MIRIFVCSLLVVLAACSGSTPKKQAPGEAYGQVWPQPVGNVRLAQSKAVPESALLDVGLVIFDPGIPEDRSTHAKLGIFPDIRKAEARYLPYILRQVLVDTQVWGAVRVLPGPEKSTQLMLTGKILQSDGERLVVAVKATDATGRTWLDKIYHDQASESDYPVAAGREPYGDLYRQIANDLMAVQQQLSPADFSAIKNVALLQYAASLSPDAFNGFVAKAEDGTLQAVRLPSADDPMLARVERIQNQEYLFIDNTDEQYQTLYDSMSPTYNLWRQNGREMAIYKEEYEARVASRDKDGRRGTYAAMSQTYNVYKRSKEHEQDLDELAQGFNNEVAPTVMEVEGKVFRLNGTLESQYGEWRSILRSIFALETGLTPLEQ
ncbi:MAG: hypothetical protein V7746_05935 [Halioglobus sp.]